MSLSGRNKNPSLAIVGRPNVGKSTLFNRLLGRRRALVHDLPGVTRDRLTETSDWSRGGRRIFVDLVDTGGMGGERFHDEIQTQVDIAVAEADVILFLLDGQAGLLPDDMALLRRLQRKTQKPVIGVVNKVDVEKHEDRIFDFHETALDPLLTISAEHGRGIDDLKDAVLIALGDKVPENAEPEEEDTLPRIAFVGRPNVGKSTLVNALLGESRMIVSPVAGTTVDSIDSLARLGEHDVVLVDTAGIRRKSKTEQGVEVLSVVQTRKALERCDVAILVLDADQGVADQDEKIGGLIEEVGCSVILLMNKWDTQQGKKNFGKEDAAEIIRHKMAFLRYAPIVFASGIRGEGLDPLGDLVEEILAQKRTKVITKEFTEWIRDKSTIHNPRGARFYMSHQAGKNPPTFVCHVNDPWKVHYSLKRHLVNGIRERWGYMGSPVRLHFVSGKSPGK